MLLFRKTILLTGLLTLLAGAAFALTPEPGPPVGQAAATVQPHITNPDDRQKAAEDRFGDFQSEAFKQGLLAAQQKVLNTVSPQLTARSKTPVWRSIGPTNANYETNGVTLNVVDSGRPRTILQDPISLDTVYVLTAGGGLWKTFNFSQVNPTWSPMTDRFGVNWGSMAFGRRSNVLYVGTGDPFDGFPALGGMMTKSTNGGAAWTSLVNLQGASTIRDVKVDTSGPVDAVLVATDVGLFRSADAGAVYSNVLTVPGQGIWSIVRTSVGWLATSSVFGTGSSTPGTLWGSSNAGATWAQLHPPALANIGRTTLGVGQPGDSIVYAFAAAKDGFSTQNLYKSIDGGQTWVGLGVNAGGTPTNPNVDQTDLDVMHDQAWYNQMVLVDPTDPNRNTVYLGGNLASVKTTNGGATWTVISDWLPGADPSTVGIPYVHADFHASAFLHIKKPASVAIAFGTDGGIFVSTNGGASFDFEKNVGLGSMLTQTVVTSGANSSLAVTGLQDNGARARLGTTSTWNQVTGGDGEGVGWSQANNARTLTSAEFNTMFWSPGLGADTIGTWHRVILPNGLFFTPMSTPTAAADPTGLLFLTANFFGAIYTPDGGASWFYLANAGGKLPANWSTRNTWHAVGVDPNPALAKFSLAGTGGRIAFSLDSGTTWTVKTLIGIVPNFPGFISSSTWSSNGILYVASERPTVGTVMVVRSTDGGTTWSQADFGLPGGPVFDILADPRDPSGNTVYAASYFGVYRTQDGGHTWSVFGTGLPIVRANGLWLTADGTLLRVATFGRGIWEINPGTIP